MIIMVKLSTFIYISGVVSYTLGVNYMDSKTAVDDWLNKKTDISVRNDYYTASLSKCTSEWDAAKFGATYNVWNTLCDSFIWPFILLGL